MSDTRTEQRGLTIEQAAARLGVSAITVRRQLDAGLLTAYRVGRLVRIDEGDLERFKQQRQRINA